MPVKSLRDLAMAAIFKNIREVEDVGDLPYEAVRPILMRVDHGAQLRQIELNSPQLQGQTAEVWVRLIERDFPLEARNRAYQPKDPKKWYRVWEKYKADQDKFLQQSENTLLSRLTTIKKEEEKNTSKIVELGAIPRSKKCALRGPRTAKTSSTLSFAGGSRTKAVNGASVMRKVRREVKEIAKIHGSLSQPVKAPTARSAVTKAPEAMVNDQKRATLPPYRPALLKEKRVLDPELRWQFAQDPEAGIRYLSEAALEDYQSRASFISDSEESGDSGNTRHKQPAPAAPKPAAPKPAALKSATKPAAARPAAPKAPTNSLQRKFGNSKSAFKAPTAPSGPVIKAHESVTKPKPKSQSQSQPQPQPEQSEPKRVRLRAFPAPDLPTTRTTPEGDEDDGPESGSDVLMRADAKAAAEIERKAPAAAARMTQIYRKRKAVDIFAHPKKRVH
ncbi:hypothetical protein M440DRAFT_1400961 [Trichoderma longibrachiatum ATCC 18648]|uniref:Elongin-A n=1 Tax=Trichoderma longibrachiatum ATCC 18648 TaxID=983965 RepID=A0A2T4C4Y1_TRILO|nr:hypothetical protein M440DRAFT_1400961 [Trichoderma longibrachiatum ATCC 18648]